MRRILEWLQDNFGTILFAVAALFLLLCIFGFAHDEHRRQEELVEAYAAWVKLTDNPKQLTFEEWRLLVSVNRQEDKQPIYAPIFIPIQ